MLLTEKTKKKIKLPKEITKEELRSARMRAVSLTVGELKEHLNKNNISDDAVIVVERVEDIYYEEHNWGVYLREGQFTFEAKKWNEDIKNGKYLDKEKFPDVKEENLKLNSEKFIKTTMEQYHPASCCFKEEENDDILFIGLHF